MVGNVNRRSASYCNNQDDLFREKSTEYIVVEPTLGQDVASVEIVREIFLRLLTCSFKLLIDIFEIYN